MPLPTTYSWPLLPDPVPPAPSLGLTFPVGASPGVCNPRYFTQQDFLDLFDRFLPASYLDPIKNVGPGYELLQAYAKMWERVSLAIGHVECGLFITLSHGGVKATVTVEFLRGSGTAGSVTVQTGTLISASKSGAQFITLEPAVFSGAALGPIAVSAESVAAGWTWNVAGQLMTPDMEILAGEIDTIDLPLQDPPFADPTITVRQITAAVGGQAAMLDQLGLDRSTPRSENETDSSYKVRIRTLDDTVSPDAIVRLLDRYTSQFELQPYDFIETWELRYQTCYDAPPPIPANPDYDTNTFCYDDPRPNPPFRNRWLDEDSHRGAFIVVVPRLSGNDFGMAFDDTGSDTLASHTNASGFKRAHNAFDVPTSSNPAILQGAYDGLGGSDPLGRNLIYKNLIDFIKAAKAGGVDAVIELEGS